MTKRARPHFRVAEFESGQPWIVMECFDGDSLSLFEKMVGFDLREGVPLEEAQRIAKFLSDNLVRISET